MTYCLALYVALLCLAERWMCSHSQALTCGVTFAVLFLVGVYQYGLGHWDQVAADEKLNLKDKLAPVVAALSKGSAASKATGVAGDGAEDGAAAGGGGQEDKTVTLKGKEGSASYTGGVWEV